MKPRLITTRPKEVYGYVVQIEVGQGRSIWKRWKVKHLSQARYRASLVSNAVRTLQCLPVTKEDWDDTTCGTKGFR